MLCAMLQAGRSSDRVTMRSMDFSNYLIFPVALVPGIYSASNINEYQNIFLGVKHDRSERLTTSPTTVSRLSRQCGILNTSQLCKPSRPVTRISLPFLPVVSEVRMSATLLVMGASHFNARDCRGLSRHGVST
jgi:hypothetical protein